MIKKISSVVAIAFLSFSANTMYGAFPITETKEHSKKVSRKKTNNNTVIYKQNNNVIATPSNTIIVNESVNEIAQGEIESANVEATSAAAAGGNKSQIVALILAIFLGTLGIHRFYLGYTWQGIVQLLTLGGLGIWSLIDIIRIATGDLQPKNDTYTESL